jgi:hypothetical protein
MMALLTRSEVLRGLRAVVQREPPPQQPGFTPNQIFSGAHPEIATVRQLALDDADQATIEKGVNFPTLQRVIGNAT